MSGLLQTYFLTHFEYPQNAESFLQLKWRHVNEVHVTENPIGWITDSKRYLEKHKPRTKNRSEQEIYRRANDLRMRRWDIALKRNEQRPKIEFRRRLKRTSVQSHNERPQDAHGSEKCVHPRFEMTYAGDLGVSDSGRRQGLAKGDNLSARHEGPLGLTIRDYRRGHQNAFALTHDNICRRTIRKSV
jgi:hypothetical protein